MYRESFEEKFNHIKDAFSDTSNPDELKEKLQKLVHEFGNPYESEMSKLFSDYGSLLFEKGNPEMGYVYLQIADTAFFYPADALTVYLRLAQYWFEKADEEKGRYFLDVLCQNLHSNYEDQIAQRGLAEVWEQYRPLVKNKIPPSISFDSETPALRPEECSMQIEKILELSRDQLLYELSSHLDEMSGDGEFMMNLNKWEKTFYDTDTLLSAVSSDGIDYYLETHGHRFEQTKKSLELIGAEKALTFMIMIEKCFPKSKVPKSLEKIETILGKMMDNDEIFDTADQFYADENIEQEIAEKEYQFVLENRKRFR